MDLNSLILSQPQDLVLRQEGLSERLANLFEHLAESAEARESFMDSPEAVLNERLGMEIKSSLPVSTANRAFYRLLNCEPDAGAGKGESVTGPYMSLLRQALAGQPTRAVAEALARGFNAEASARALPESADVDLEADTDADVDTDLDAASDVDIDLDAESDVDTDLDADSDIEAELETRTGVDLEIDAEADADTDLEATLAASADAELKIETELTTITELKAQLEIELKTHVEAALKAQVEAKLEQELKTSIELKVTTATETKAATAVKVTTAIAAETEAKLVTVLEAKLQAEIEARATVDITVEEELRVELEVGIEAEVGLEIKQPQRRAAGARLSRVDIQRLAGFVAARPGLAALVLSSPAGRTAWSRP